VNIVVLWPLGCKNVQKKIEMMASDWENELKKMAGVDAVDDDLSIFGTREASCFPFHHGRKKNSC